MAIVMKCDRCGKLYAHYDGSIEFGNYAKANGFMFIDSSLDKKYLPRKSYDLCVDCMRKLEAFVKNKKDMSYTE